MTAPISSYSPTTWVNGALGATPLSADNLNKLEGGVKGAFDYARQMNLVLTPTKTAAYTPVASDFALYNATSANIVNQLPQAQPGMRIGLKKTDGTPNTVLFNVYPGDTIDGAATSLTLRLPNEVRTLLGYAGGWVLIHGNTTLTSLDTRYGTRIDNLLGAGYTAPLACEIRPSAATASLAAATTTPLAANWSATIDPFSMFSLSSDAYRVTLPIAGRYDVEFTWYQSVNNTSGYMQAWVTKNRPNGTAVATSTGTYSMLTHSVVQTTATQMQMRGSEVFAASDFLGFFVQVTTAANLLQTVNTLSRSKIVVRYVGTT